MAVPSLRLRRLAEGLFGRDGSIRFCGFRLHRRMTVVRLKDGRLLLHSPNAPDHALREELDALGTVAFLIVPSAIHGRGALEMSRAYPDAKVLAAPGTAKRRKHLRIDGTLFDAPEAAWEAELDQALLEGNSLSREVVFLHRASRTLIVTDLVENLRWRHLSLGGWLVAGVSGLLWRPTYAPEHWLFLDDPDAMAGSLAKARSWDFDRIVLAHGDVIETGGKAVFDDVATRLLRSGRRRFLTLRWLLRPFAWLFWMI